MRIILLLVSLLIVAVLVYQQISVHSPNDINSRVEKTIEDSGVNVPRVPVRPQDVQAFGEQMNTYMNDAASQRSKQIEKAQQ